MKRLLTALLVFLASILLNACGGGTRQAGERLLYTPLGASDAVGIGAFPITDGYTYRIEAALEERVPTVDFLNLGIPDGKAEVIRQLLERTLKAGLKPDLVTLWTGANDVIAGEDVDDFEENLEEILDQLRKKTDALVFIADIPDLTRLPRFQLKPETTVTRERIDAFNAIIYEQAEEHDVSVVRLSTIAPDQVLISDIDGFHPSSEGHKQIADAFLSVILPAYKLKP